MATVQIQKAEPDTILANSLTNEINDLVGRLRHRAYHLFEARAGKGGNELDDWLHAEEELLVPIESDIKTIDGGYQLALSIPDFDPNNLKVYIIGETLIVKGEKARTFADVSDYSDEAQSIFYQWIIPAGTSTSHITADWKDSVLTITAPTQPQPPRIQSVVSAAQTSSAAA